MKKLFASFILGLSLLSLGTAALAQAPVATDAAVAAPAAAEAPAAETDEATAA